MVNVRMSSAIWKISCSRRSARILRLDRSQVASAIAYCLHGYLHCPANVLVLDEPTNDLDIETLELLEALLQDYTGTLFVVSHDREFLDNVVTQVIAFEGNGKLREYISGYEDWISAKNFEDNILFEQKILPKQSEITPSRVILLTIIRLLTS